MITLAFALTTFLSTFFAMFHFISSFMYKKEPAPPAKKHLGFSVIIPCYNEAPILLHTLSGILKIVYDQYEVIFVNDGSSDDTYHILDQELELYDCEYTKFALSKSYGSIKRSRKYDFIYVIDKNNTGKADSLNCGISFCHNELVVTLDGDCILEKDALSIMNNTFRDDEIIASGGSVHVMQIFMLKGRRKFIIGLQAVDFIKGFYIYKPSLAYNNALSIISGAFGVFRKAALVEVEGFHDGLGEDIDITLRLQEYAVSCNKKITYNPQAICYTECPENIKDLSKQRVRWQKAFLDAIFKNRKFLFRNVLKVNVCFFMIIDALFSGTAAVISFFINLILISAKLIIGFPFLFFMYFILVVFFNTLNAYVAIKRAQKSAPLSDRPYLYLMIAFDLICFSFLRIWFFLRGTLSYCFNHTEWDKVERTRHLYQYANDSIVRREG